MLLRLINKVLQPRGYILLEKHLLDECMRLSIAYLQALQREKNRPGRKRQKPYRGQAKW